MCNLDIKDIEVLLNILDCRISKRHDEIEEHLSFLDTFCLNDEIHIFETSLISRLLEQNEKEIDIMKKLRACYDLFYGD